MRKKKDKFFKPFTFFRKKDNKTLLTILISITIIITFLPFVFAQTQDILVISFDPTSDIDIDVSKVSWNFSSVTVNDWTNTTGEQFTLYNNGTIAMDTEIRADNTSAEGDMFLNESGVAPGTDEFAIYIEDLDIPQFLNESYVTDFDQNLAPAALKSFDICLLMGTNTSANHSWQNVNISFRGSIT